MTKPQLQPAVSFCIVTDPGNGPVTTESFETAEERLETLRARARAYFPGTDVPKPLGPTGEEEYLAMLLGFFLMLTDGKVSLTENPRPAEEIHSC